MKKNIIFATLIASAFLFGSCDRKVEFQSESFATFEMVSYAVSESAGKLTIPVTIYNPTNREVQVIVRANDSTAFANKDFSISYPKSGVLTFAPGEATKNVEIDLVHDKKMTGSKYFEVVIASADDSFSVGNLNTALCKIKDREDPRYPFLGEWTGNAVDVYNNNTEVVFDVTITEDENDETLRKLKIKDLDPISSYMTTVYTLKASRLGDSDDTITVASEQVYSYYDAYQSYYYFYAFTVEGDGVYLGTEVTITYNQEDDSLIINDAYGTLFTYTDGGQYIGSLYAPGAVLTRK